jgi:hypothetical protein
MNATPRPSNFWINWLLAASAGVVAFGFVLVLAPALTVQGFSLLVYASSSRIDSFGTEQLRYISLVHAVLGGVMVGWGAALLYATKALLAAGSRVGWNIIALSLATWFVPDTAYSLVSGFWQNAVLNSVFLIAFAIPLWATRTSVR